MLVWVEHDSKAASHGPWWQVLGEGSSHYSVVSVVCNNLAPDALVVEAGFGVLGLVDELNTLAVVPSGTSAVLDTLDVEEGGIVLLAALSPLESHEDGLGVKSTRNQVNQQIGSTYLTGSRVCLDFDFVSMSTFNLIFM